MKEEGVKIIRYPVSLLTFKPSELLSPVGSAICCVLYNQWKLLENKKGINFPTHFMKLEIS